MSKLKNLHVKDIIISIDDYPNILIGAPVGEAIHLMHHVLEDRDKYRNILVLDDDDKLMGYLSLRDLIRSVGPGYLHKVTTGIKGNQPFQAIQQDFSALSLIWEERFTEKLHDELSKPVTQHMTLINDHVSPDDHITKCIHLMLLDDVLMLPVVENEKVLGVVRLVDIFENLAEHVEQEWYPKNNT